MKKITIKNYQKHAMKTCLPSARNWDYATHNYRAELFELLAKIESFHAKQIRDGADFDKTKYLDKIADEFGDCYWQLALLCELGGRQFVQGYCECGSLNSFNIPMGYELDIMNEFARLDHIRWAFRWEIDFAINDILQRNIDKLASRAERGVLKGSGDER